MNEENRDKRTGRSKLWAVLVPVAVIVVGVAIMGALKATRKPPARGQMRPRGALVETVAALRGARQISIESHGTVRPRYESTLVPQVQGRVEWAHENLVAGGGFQEGDELLRIERADYELAVQRAQAQVAQAELAIEVERANSAIALREWNLMNRSRESLSGEDNEPDPLVLREPQLRQAEAGLASARAALATAELNLSRTSLRAPFNCRVRHQSVAPGQLVGPGIPVAAVYNTDLVEIEIGVPLSEMSWMDIPGAEARIVLDSGESQHEWIGYVDRSVGVLEEMGRLSRVVIRIENPFDSQHGADLNIGSFVCVSVAGHPVDECVPIPRAALRENDTVWVMNAVDRLEIRTVRLARMTTDEALVIEGLEQRDRVVLTSLAGAVPGMILRSANGSGEQGTGQAAPDQR